MPESENTLPLEFPKSGVHRGTEFELQPVLTTPVGANVRGYEPTLLRFRGGSRCGTSKLIADRVNGDSPVQHLNTLTYQDADALLTQYESSFSSALRYPRIIDPSSNCRGTHPQCEHPTSGDFPFMPPEVPPSSGVPGGGPPGGPNTPGSPTAYRNPGRLIRRGGNGVQPNRRRGTPPEANDDYGSADVGGSDLTVSVLSNDHYSGTPTVTILQQPSRGSATVNGSNQIVFTPPAFGSAGDVTVIYRLTCTGMQGSDTAVVTIHLRNQAEEGTLFCMTYEADPFYGTPGEFGFPETVCRCSTATGDWSLTFGSGPQYVLNLSGSSLPDLGTMNAAADAWAALNSQPPFSPSFYTNAIGPTDSGPC